MPARMILPLILGMLVLPVFPQDEAPPATEDTGDFSTYIADLTKRAEGGAFFSQYLLGSMYEFGDYNVPQDYKEAARWYRAAAEQGYDVAQEKLGDMYWDGKGVSKDYKEAVRWWRAAAEQGHAGAQHSLGFMYLNGWGVPQDYKEVVRWFKAAAEQGYVEAQHNLGTMYSSPQGVPQDYKEAVRWWRAAAEQGHVSSQYNLGVMYRWGRGVPQDYTEAVRWYRAAAEQGHVDAQYNLGVMYSKGQGVTQDYIQAHMWYNLAAASGGDDEDREKAVNNRDSIAEEMTAEQIAEAQRLAREWKPKAGGQSLVAGTVAQSSITAADFEVYRDSEYGFTFWYPKTWLSVPTTHSRTRIKVVSDNGLGEEDCLSGVHYSEEIKDLSPKDFITSVSKPEGILALQRYMSTIYADYELLEHHITKLSNQDAAYTVSRATSESMGLSIPMQILQVATMRRGYVYTLTCRAAPEKFEEYKPLFELILWGFILHPEAPAP